jgi:hypothetical protein
VFGLRENTWFERRRYPFEGMHRAVSCLLNCGRRLMAALKSVSLSTATQLTLMSAQLLLCHLHTQREREREREREKVKMGHRKNMKIYNGDMGLHGGGRYSGWVTDRDDSRGFACYSVLAKNERP